MIEYNPKTGMVEDENGEPLFCGFRDFLQCSKKCALFRDTFTRIIRTNPDCVPYTACKHITEYVDICAAQMCVSPPAEIPYKKF